MIGADCSIKKIPKLFGGMNRIGLYRKSQIVNRKPKDREL